MTLKYIITGIMIGCMFCLPVQGMAAGDEKAKDAKGVESVEPTKPSLKELQLEARYLEEHFKVLSAEQQATRQRYQEVQEAIKKIEGVKKEEKAKKK
jgi:predicted nuclease with TOPRIM domain